MTRIGAVVQARMSSSRLPGKVLHRVAGKPLLGYLLDRLEKCRGLDALVVATSTDASDLPVAEYSATRHVECHRGPLADVAARFLEVAERHALGAFVRVSGDSPLLDPGLVESAVSLFRAGSVADVVTNVFPRSFPHGQSVEVIRAASLRAAYPRFEPADREHVTTFFYRNAREFEIENFRSDQDASGIHLAVDTLQDMEAFRTIVSRMDRPHTDYGLAEILELGAVGE